MAAYTFETMTQAQADGLAARDTIRFSDTRVSAIGVAIRSTDGLLSNNVVALTAGGRTLSFSSAALSGAETWLGGSPWSITGRVVVDWAPAAATGVIHIFETMTQAEANGLTASDVLLFANAGTGALDVAVTPGDGTTTLSAGGKALSFPSVALSRAEIRFNDGSWLVPGTNRADGDIQTDAALGDADGAIIATGTELLQYSFRPGSPIDDSVVLHGFAGDDRIRLEAAYGVVPASSFTDDGGVTEERSPHNHVFGGAGADYIVSGRGNDHIYGNSNTALAGGEDGADSIHAGPGSDYVQGNAGDDSLFGGGGRDRIQGGQGDDVIRGDFPEFELDALGVDGAYFDEKIGYIVYGEGSDTINGNRGDDTIFGGFGHDLLRGGKDNDLIVGGPFEDSLYVWTLYGDRPAGYGLYGDDDSLHGDLGDDTLVGGMGADLLFGGDGDDVFKFNAIDSMSDRAVINGYATTYVAGIDTIGDFRVGDKIDLPGVTAGGGASILTAASRFDTVDAALNHARQQFDGMAGGGVGQAVAALNVGGDAYIFFRTTSGDSVVKLAGVDAATLTASDFV